MKLGRTGKALLGEQAKEADGAQDDLAMVQRQEAECDVDGGLMMRKEGCKGRTKGWFCSTVGVGLRSGEPK